MTMTMTTSELCLIPGLDSKTLVTSPFEELSRGAQFVAVGDENARALGQWAIPEAIPHPSWASEIQQLMASLWEVASGGDTVIDPLLGPEYYFRLTAAEVRCHPKGSWVRIVGHTGGLEIVLGAWGPLEWMQEPRLVFGDILGTARVLCASEPEESLCWPPE